MQRVERVEVILAEARLVVQVGEKIGAFEEGQWLIALPARALHNLVASLVHHLDGPLPWTLSHDISLNGSFPAVLRRANASVMNPKAVVGPPSPAVSVRISGRCPRRSPWTG